MHTQRSERKVKVDPYDPAWPRAWPRDFREEAERLRAAFGLEVIYIHHIGRSGAPPCSGQMAGTIWARTDLTASPCHRI